MKYLAKKRLTVFRNKLGMSYYLNICQMLDGLDNFMEKNDRC